MDDERSAPEYAHFRLELIRRVLGGFSAEDVAGLLECERERFHQITDAEIEKYRPPEPPVPWSGRL